MRRKRSTRVVGWREVRGKETPACIFVVLFVLEGME